MKWFIIFIISLALWDFIVYIGFLLKDERPCHSALGMVISCLIKFWIIVAGYLVLVYN